MTVHPSRTAAAEKAGEAATQMRAGPRAGAAGAAALTGAGVALALAALPLGPGPQAAGLALYALTGVLVVAGLGPAHPHPRFGLANTLTLARAGGASVLAALVLAPRALDEASGWGLAAGAGLLLALDGLDGWAARRQGLTSAFGARFDMETDALLILVLAGLVAALGKAGDWVLAIGLMRYAFVLAALVWPRLAHPLPPSRRRRLVCGLQVGILALILTPPVTPPLSSALALATLAILGWSFARDLRWLHQRPAA